jgi:hypothetical protein
MKAKLLLALALFSSVASARTPEIVFANSSELSPLEGYIGIGAAVVYFGFSGETARTLYTRLPGSSIIRPDNVCSRGLKVPPTVKRYSGIRCERYVPEAGAATYKCITSTHLYSGTPIQTTEEYVCGLSQVASIKTPEEEEQDFQKILNGNPPIGYSLVQLNGTPREQTPVNGNFSVKTSSAEFVFSGEAAQVLYEAMPKHLTVPKGKTCTTGEKIRPTIKRSKGFRCARTPSADKKSATYSCYTRLDFDQGWIEVASEEILCKEP